MLSRSKLTFTTYEDILEWMHQEGRLSARGRVQDLAIATTSDHLRIDDA